MRKIFLILVAIPGVTGAAETIIHRCAQDDGTVAFQETPCAEADVKGETEDDTPPGGEGAAPADEFFEFVNPFDKPAGDAAQSEPESALPPSEDRAACEKETRDAIDAIDAELQNGQSTGDARQHLAELLELTRQLRACKAL